MSLIFRNSKVIRNQDSTIDFPSSIHSGYSKSSSYQEVVIERSSEEWATFDLREILSACIVNQLCILWKESRNPALWLAKTLILFILLSDSWKKRITA